MRMKLHYNSKNCAKVWKLVVGIKVRLLAAGWWALIGVNGCGLGEGGGFSAQKFNKIPIVEPYTNIS